MSTRGYMGIKKKGQLKGQYNHFDSYISGLGKDIIEALNNIPKNERINKNGCWRLKKCFAFPWKMDRH